MMKGGLLAKTIAGWLGDLVAIHQKAFQPTIPDSQGQVSNKKVNYRVAYS